MAPAISTPVGPAPTTTKVSWLTAEMVNICERARSVKVSEVCSAATVSIDENARLAEAIPAFLAHQTLSLLVTRRGRTVGVLRLSDFFDELARQIMRGECPDEPEA